MSKIYQDELIANEDLHFLSDLEKITKKPISNLRIRGKLKPTPALQSKYTQYMPKMLQEATKSLGTDRFGLNEIIIRNMGFFAKDNKVRELVLKGLKQIPETIRNLSKLEKLYIECEQLKELPESIVDLKSLRVLNLIGSGTLQKLPDELGHLELLEEFQINGMMHHIPENIGKLNNLRILNFLGTSNLTSLPESIGELESLEILNIVGNSNCSLKMRNVPITKIPSSIGKLNNLKILNLCGCKSLTSLPETLGDLESLERLDLGEYDKDLTSIARGAYNPLINTSLKEIRSLNRSVDYLPESVGNLKNLKQLDLSFWKSFKFMPESIGDLKYLESLNLRFCDSLTSLPESICKLEKLQELNLRCCYSLKELPDSIGNLAKSLKKLNLFGCKCLSSLPASFKKLTNLEYLDLRNCNFTDAPKDIPNLENLKSIDLSGNPLSEDFNEFSKRIKKKIIDTLPYSPHQIYIKLKNNKISKIEAENHLLEMIQHSNSNYIKARALEIINHHQLKGDTVFEKMSEIIQEEKDEIVQTAALKVLIDLFQEDSMEYFVNLADNIKSAFVLTTLFEYSSSFPLNKSNEIQNNILDRYAECYGVVKEEAKFFLDLELQRTRITTPSDIFFGIGRDFKVGFGSEGRFEWKELQKWYSLEAALHAPGESHVSYVVHEGHVIGIYIDDWEVKEVPESISLLSELEVFVTGMIHQLPDCMSHLKKLRHVSKADINGFKLFEEQHGYYNKI